MITHAWIVPSKEVARFSSLYDKHPTLLLLITIPDKIGNMISMFNRKDALIKTSNTKTHNATQEETS